jgi:hypothetical protein
MDDKPAEEPSLIQSRQNPKVKFLASLRKKRNRDQYGCFLIEGRKELESFLATEHRQLKEGWEFLNYLHTLLKNVPYGKIRMVGLVSPKTGRPHFLR